MIGYDADNDRIGYRQDKHLSYHMFDAQLDNDLIGYKS